MINVIRAIALAASIQVLILGFLIGYLFVHADNMAQNYALIAERNSNAYTNEVVHDQYNTLQRERESERDSLHTYIDKRIDLKIYQALREPRK